MSICPCGSEKEFSKCCEPYINGKKSAPTAESLMRARYSAFATGAVEYIFKTHHESTKGTLDQDGIKSWALESTWLGLSIVETKEGGEKDSTGEVEFRCQFNYGGKDQYHHELSSFKKENGEWFFVDGKLIDGTVKRTEPKIGRNDPCSCGSGKKFKKCCGV
jgi:SEC-C motif-containing protein